MNPLPNPAAKFLLGRVYATPNALDTVPNEEILRALQRHHSGDWGDVCPEDHEANEQALREGTACSQFIVHKQEPSSGS